MQRAIILGAVLAFSAGAASASLIGEGGFDYDVLLQYNAFLSSTNSAPFSFPGPEDGRLDVPSNQVWGVNTTFEPGGGGGKQDGKNNDAANWHFFAIDASLVRTDKPIVVNFVGLPEDWDVVGSSIFVSCVAGTSPLEGAALIEDAVPNGWDLVPSTDGQDLIVAFTPDQTDCSGAQPLPDHVRDLWFQVEVVPEPTTLGLLGVALLALVRRRG